MADARRVSAKLPPELKLMVITFLPNSDLKNVRLVNKQWSAIAAIDLWSHFNTDLIETRSRKMSAILNSGILDNVKKLSIQRTRKKMTTAQEKEAFKNLFRVFTALPKECLKGFACNLRVSRETMSLYLQTQPHISSLQINISKNGQTDILKSDHIQGCLDNLEELCADIDDSCEGAYLQYATWFQHAPTLRRLTIRGHHPDVPNVFDGFILPPTTPSLKLRRLELLNLDLRKSAVSPAEQLSLTCLQQLRIVNCCNTEPLLTALAESSVKGFMTSLVSLDISGADSEYICTASARLIRSAGHLTDLWLDTVMPEILGLDCLEQCGASLRQLHACSSERQYKSEHLDEMVQLCPKLEMVGLTLLEFFEPSSLEQLRLRLSPSETYTRALELYAKSLRSLAHLPNLKSLKLVHDPYFEERDDKMERHQQLATDIMQILVKSGSSIEYVHFHPGFVLYNSLSSSQKDANGHLWPHYSYGRAQITLNTSQHQGVISTVAVPVDYRADPLNRHGLWSFALATDNVEQPDLWSATGLDHRHGYGAFPLALDLFERWVLACGRFYDRFLD